MKPLNMERVSFTFPESAEIYKNEYVVVNKYNIHHMELMQLLILKGPIKHH
jgi:hypothetical protein